MRRLARHLTIGRLAGIALIAIFVALRFWDPPVLENIRSMTFDLYQVAHPRTVTDYPVTIVDIDERALKALGQWPWPRTIVAEVVDRLAAGGAAAIGFDTIFAEPDRLSPRRIAESVTSLDPGAKLALEALPDSDQKLAEALSRTRAVLGQSGLPRSSGREEQAAALPHTSIVTIGGDPLSDLISLPQLLANLPELEKAAAGRGLFTVQPDRDGVTRRIPTILAIGNEIRPALSIELLRVASGANSLLVKRDEAGVKSIVVAGVEITTDRNGELWLHFSPHDPKRYVSAIDILQNKVPPDRIEGKLILIGTSAVGLFDFRSTPVERVMPGVEIHAQAIESILGGSLLVRPNYALGAEVCLAILIGVGMVVAVPMLGALPALLLGGLVAALLISYSWYLFVAKKILLDVVYPLLSSLAVFLLLTFLNYFREEKRRAQIRSAFSQYLAPEWVEQLTREPDRLVLGGETRVMSVLFSDVRGFTAIAEGFKSNPSGLTALMNRLLTPVSKAIIERRGTIDKYIGDAVMAFWNAPLDDPDHALHACEAALEIIRRLDILNAERTKEAQLTGETSTDMQIGVGLSTGESVVGNMGSDIRFDYSVLGDSVNLASRLEGLTAAYGLRILLCAETARRCAEKLALVEIDCVRVKGKADVATIFTLLGGPDLLQQSHFRAFRGAFNEMREQYRLGDFHAARLALERSRRNNENPQLAKVLDLYAKRLAELEVGPAIANWDGVYSSSAASVST